MFVNILIWILFGAVAGWIASKLMGSSNSLVINVILGIIGSVVGGFVAGLLGIDANAGFNIVSLLIAVVGACIVIFLARLISR